MNKKIEKKAKKNPVFVKAYLIGYNGIQTLGWTYMLYQLISFYLSSHTFGDQTLYETLKWTVIIFQNAAVLEIIHAATGIVHSNPILTAFQVMSRVIIVCGVLIITYSSRESIGLTLCILAWSITEIIRYSMYTLSLLDVVPYFVKWLRYSFFVFLYPLGITGELLCLYAAQQEVGAGKLYAMHMPNKYNFNFNYQYVLIFIMLLYIPFFPQLYLHMFSQRRKSLGPQSYKKTN